MWTSFDLLSIETWILLLSSIALSRYFIHRKWQYLKNMNIPHDPPSLLKFGHILDLLGKDKVFKIENEMKKRHGLVWGSYAFFSPYITIHDPDILRQIFIKEFHAFPVRQRNLTKLNGKELNSSLTNTEGKQWKRLRSTMTPTFSTSKMRSMIYIMDRCVDSAARVIDKNIANNDGVFNSKTIFSRLSLDIVCSAAFSTEVNSQEGDKEPEIVKHVKALFGGSILSPMVLLCFACPPLEKVFAYFNISGFPRVSLDYFRGLTNHVIKQRETDPHPELRRVDLMQLLLDSEISEAEAKSEKLEKGMARNEIIGNSMLMIMAGYENTGNTMSFFTYCMATNPDIQRQLQEEIDEMVESKGVFNYDTVGNLKFLDMCMNETLRLYNPVLKNFRLCDQEVTIDGLTIPKGINVCIPSFALSRDPDYWEDPEDFKPERMRDMSQVDSMMFQPFGAGPRNCIGMRFAVMEVKMAMAKLFHKYTFLSAKNTPEPPLKLIFGISIRPEVDYDLKAVKRRNF